MLARLVEGITTGMAVRLATCESRKGGREMGRAEEGEPEWIHACSLEPRMVVFEGE